MKYFPWLQNKQVLKEYIKTYEQLKFLPKAPINNKGGAFMDKTITATITQDEIDRAEAQYWKNIEGLEELERYIGTYETYGAVLQVKPNYAKAVNDEN